MKMQVLVSSVNREMEELIESMHLSSDAIIINQGKMHEYRETKREDATIRYYGFQEKGVGLSRNNALLRATADIVLFSDEDIVYDEGYEEKVLRAFEENPTADMLLFNFRVPKERQTYHIEKKTRIRWYNCGRYPTYSFAVRREKLHKAKITYSLLFGGGAKYSAGEDSLFIRDCIKAGFVVYGLNITLGQELERESSWFRGYTEKFFFDRGVLYHFLYGPAAKLLALRFLLTKKSFMCKEVDAKKAWKLMKQGIAEGKK